MAAEVQDPNLSKVDSAIADEPGSPTDAKPKKDRRTSSTASNVFNIADLEKEGTQIKIAPETQQTGWKINTSPASIDDPSILKKPLCTPMLKKIDLHFPLGMEVTARNLKGVTIKDALDAIHKQYKKRADDEMDNPYFAGFEWDPEENYQKFIVHLSKLPTTSGPTGGKSKKKNKGGDGE